MQLNERQIASIERIKRCNRPSLASRVFSLAFWPLMAVMVVFSQWMGAPVEFARVSVALVMTLSSFLGLFMILASLLAASSVSDSSGRADKEWVDVLLFADKGRWISIYSFVGYVLVFLLLIAAGWWGSTTLWGVLGMSWVASKVVYAKVRIERLSQM